MLIMPPTSLLFTQKPPFLLEPVFGSANAASGSFGTTVSITIDVGASADTKFIYLAVIDITGNITSSTLGGIDLQLDTTRSGDKVWWMSGDISSLSGSQTWIITYTSARAASPNYAFWTVDDLDVSVGFDDIVSTVKTFPGTTGTVSLTVNREKRGGVLGLIMTQVDFTGDDYTWSSGFTEEEDIGTSTSLGAATGPSGDAASVEGSVDVSFNYTSRLVRYTLASIS